MNIYFVTLLTQKCQTEFKVFGTVYGYFYA